MTTNIERIDALLEEARRLMKEEFDKGEYFYSPLECLMFYVQMLSKYPDTTSNVKLTMLKGIKDMVETIEYISR